MFPTRKSGDLVQPQNKASVVDSGPVNEKIGAASGVETGKTGGGADKIQRLGGATTLRLSHRDGGCRAPADQAICSGVESRQEKNPVDREVRCMRFRSRHNGLRHYGATSDGEEDAED